ncbi:MAG: hypothetical protein ACFCUH_11910, partial [Flavobacteriales bacterium]
MGLTSMEVQAQDDETDCEYAVSVVCADDVFVECADDFSPEALMSFPEVFVLNDCGDDLPVGLTHIDVPISGDDCQYVIARTWLAQLGDAVAMCTQTITVSDFTGPEFIDFPEDISMSCVEEVPGPVMVSAEDACNSVTEVEIFTSETGAPIEECIASTAFGPGAD